jgi:hypothetical protein
MALHWRRGFFRLWLAVSILWIAGSTWAGYRNIVAPFEAAERQQKCVNERKAAGAKTFEEFNCGPITFDELDPIGPKILEYSIIGLSFPLLTFAFGAGLGWVLSGFRR